MSEPGASAIPADRRSVSAGGTFLGGQAAIGGNLFVALGLVIQASRGGAGFAFALSGLVFLLVGLAYVEMVTALPVAGGAQYFVLRGLGDFWGFIAGAALILDLTIGIALFATMTASYANTFAPVLLGIEASTLAVHLPVVGRFEWFWFAESLAAASSLVVANCRGLKEKARLNAAVGIATLVGLSVLVVAGFLFSWNAIAFVDTLHSDWRGLRGFGYGLSLSIISFVGLQTLALTAAECRRPAAVMPRPSIALILTTVLFALALPHLALGAATPSVFGHGEAPLAVLAALVPSFGPALSSLISGLACAVLLASANSFLASVSRLAYSMGQYDSLGPWARQTHPRFHTPIKALAVFGALIAGELSLAFFWPGATPLEVLANMYAFGAMLAYSLAMIAVIRLRSVEPHLPRPYRVPISVSLALRGGRTPVPLLAIAALMGSLMLLGFVVATHEIGRIAGPGWILVCTGYYLMYRRSNGLPLFGSIRRDWPGEQVRLLRAADESDQADLYSRARALGAREGHP